MVVELIQTDGHVRLVIAVHIGVHAEFPQCCMRIVDNGTLTKHSLRYRPLRDNGIFDKSLQLGEHSEQRSLEAPLIQHLATLFFPVKTHKLYVVARHVVAGIVAEEDDSSVCRTIVCAIIESDRSQLRTNILPR